MKPMRTLVVTALFVLIAIAVGVWLYPHLPERVPIHWDLAGNANGWGSPFWAVAVWPLLIAGIGGLTVVLPAISPRKFEITPFASTYQFLMLVLQAFLLVVGISAMLAGAGYPVPIPFIATLAVGVLLMVIGNYMGKLRKNFFIGVRTPWTLASDAVWERTHRMGGWVFMAAGVAWIVVALAVAPQRAAWWLLAIVLVAAAIPCAYSYIAYRRVEGGAGSNGDP